MMVGEVEVKERPRPSPDYLMQLLNEKKLMTSLPNLCGIFTHLERLLDEGKRSSRGGEGERVTTARCGAPAPSGRPVLAVITI
ncbi:Protein quaking-A [Liparis tanakae]|uniref:Protein quaking-A n=1 Tax=Liparis tanakae TaxID=230148 RepID=A0A4Z2FUQ9_9TELE|nr:Protein quaking-A [Liparis tanakae]